MKKRILSALMAIVICTIAMGMASVSSTETTNVTEISLLLDNAEVYAGNEITVPVSISNNVGLTGLELSIGYNAAVLTLTEITKGEALASLSFTKPGNYALNPIKLLWDGMDADASNGSIALLKFTIVDNVKSADVNEDGIVDTRDVILIRRYIAGRYGVEIGK